MAAVHRLFKIPEALRHNVRIKTYPGNWKNVLVCQRAVFSEPGWVPADDLQGDDDWERPLPQHDPIDSGYFDSDDRLAEWAGAQAARAAANLERAVRRARAQVRDLALCTPFAYFVTLTLAPAKVDRFDMAAITRKLTAWCDNHVRRHGLAYVLVPERHKDGAIHFHGFFNDALEAVDSGTMTQHKGKPRKPRTEAQRALWASQGCHTVYNLPAWSLGFTTAIALYGEYDKAVSYVCKYIGKDNDFTPGEGKEPHLAGKIGGRWYYSGGDLGRPQVDYADLMDEDFEGMAQVEGAWCFDIPAAGLKFVQITLKGGDETVQDAGNAPVLPQGGQVPSGGLLRPLPPDGLCPVRRPGA